jgi:hypothetical protein
MILKISSYYFRIALTNLSSNETQYVVCTVQTETLYLCNVD